MLYLLEIMGLSGFIGRIKALLGLKKYLTSGFIIWIFSSSFYMEYKY